MSLGTNISRLRAEHHLSQGDLAEALAVSRQSVSKWETDSSVPDLDKLVKLSQLFGVSLDEDLLEPFDALCARKGYGNRSEAIRDLIRRALVEEDWQNPQLMGAGTLTLVYDHHKNDLSRRLTQMQHDEHDIIVATLHVHLDHDNCLEVLVLKGDPERVRRLADKLISCKGVKHGTFSGTTTGRDLA